MSLRTEGRCQHNVNIKSFLPVVDLIKNDLSPITMETSSPTFISLLRVHFGSKLLFCAYLSKGMKSALAQRHRCGYFTVELVCTTNWETVQQHDC